MSADGDAPVLLAIEGDALVPIARVRGEVDMSNVDALEAQIARAVPNTAYGLVLDLSETAYLDSQGIRLLLSLRGALARHGQQLRVVAGREAPVRRLLEIVRLDRELAIDHDREAAASAIAAAQRA